MGRQSTYTEEMASRILVLLADGHPLNTICCADDSLPAESTVRGWVLDNPSFAAKYARARGIGLEVRAENMTAISDDKSLDPAVRRDMLETRKWLFARMNPAKWGERTSLEHTGAGGAPLTLTVQLVKPKDTQ